MGAILRFKRLTGKEVTDISGLSDWVDYLYCCIASATQADTGTPFPMSRDDFADSTPQEAVGEWVAALQDESEAVGDAAKGEKKSPQR